MKISPIIFVLYALLYFCIQAAGQEAQPLLRLGSEELDERMGSDDEDIRTVSRSRIESDDLPVTVYIVKREEILANGYTTLVDVLKSVPEIKVSQPGNGIQGETFLLRGLLGNYYVTILIDGIPILPSAVSGLPIADQLPVRQAQRIEIILGPSSAVYGPEAAAGVINIVTQKSERPVHVQSDISVGNYGQEYLNLLIGGKLGKGKNVLSYSFFGNHGRQDDMNIKYDIPGNYSPVNYDTTFSFLQAPFYKGDSLIAEMNELPETSRMMGFRLEYRGLSFSAMNAYRQTHSSIGLNTALYTYSDPGNFWGEQINRYALTYDKEWQKLGTTTNLTYLRYRLDNRSSFGLTIDGGVNGKGYKYSASDDVQLEQIFNYKANRLLTLTAGADLKIMGNLPLTNDLKEPFDKQDYKPFSIERIELDSLLGNFGYNPVNLWNAGIFLQMFFDWERLNVLASARMDYHSMFNWNINPRIALNYKLTNAMALRASFSTAYRAPSTYFIYQSLAYAVPTGGAFYDIVPNPELKEENLVAAELGYRFRPSDQVQFDAVIYYHRLKNQFTRSLFPLDTAIYPVPPANGNYFTYAYVNSDSTRADLLGLQLNTTVKDIIPSIGFDIEVSLTLSKGNEILPYGLGELDNYRQWPQFMGQVNLSVHPWKRVYFYLRNSFSGKTYRRFFLLPPEILEQLGYRITVPAYYTLDFIGRVNIGKNLQAFIRLSNLLNAKYGGIDAYDHRFNLNYNPQYGRHYNLGLSFNFE